MAIDGAKRQAEQTKEQQSNKVPTEPIALNNSGSKN